MNSLRPSPSLFFNQSWIFTTISPQSPLPANSPIAALLASSLGWPEGKPPPSGHDVKERTIIEGPDSGKVVFYKKCDANYPPILAQIEAAASASLRIVRLDCAARIRPVVNEIGEVIGSASYAIPGFTPFTKLSLTYKQLLEQGLADELVGRYFRGENDLHPGNIGLNKEEQIVGIDFDECFYEFVAFIKGLRVIDHAASPTLSFPLTRRDVANVNELQDAKPCFWPAQIPRNGNLLKVFPNKEEFKKLSFNDSFHEKMYFAFLKELLIGRERHMMIMGAHFSLTEEGDSQLQVLAGWLNNRLDQLENILSKDPEFRKLLVTRQLTLQQCQRHFEDYNKQISLLEITFDLSEVTQKFEQLLKKCFVEELILALYDLGLKIKKADRDHKAAYHKLINHAIKFEKDKCPLMSGYVLLASHVQLALIDHEISPFCATLQRVIQNYRGVICGEEVITPTQSVHYALERRDSVSLEEEGVVIEKCLAKALFEWLSSPKNVPTLLKIARECLAEYRPVGHNSMFASLNPKNYTRTRVESLDELIKSLEADENKHAAIVKFVSGGAWKSSWAFSSASANVLLISKLCKEVITDFKENLTLEQLKKHKLVEVCYSIDLGTWDLQKASEKIADFFIKETKK